MESSGLEGREACRSFGGRSDVFVSKVKGHASNRDVASGRVTAVDKEGNDAADSLATCGADLHVLDKETLHLAMARCQVAMSVQRLTMAILECRSQQQQQVQQELAYSAYDDTAAEDASDKSEWTTLQLVTRQAIRSRRRPHCLNRTWFSMR